MQGGVLYLRGFRRFGDYTCLEFTFGYAIAFSLTTQKQSRFVRIMSLEKSERLNIYKRREINDDVNPR